MLTITKFFATKPLPPKPTAIAMIMVGCLLLVGAGLWGKSAYDLGQNGIRTEALVVQLERPESAYFPVFVFKDIKGREHTVRSSASSRSYVVGHTVPTVYNPATPLNAEIDRPLMLYIGPGIIGFIGVMFFLGAALVLRIMPMMERAYHEN